MGAAAAISEQLQYQVGIALLLTMPEPAFGLVMPSVETEAKSMQTEEVTEKIGISASRALSLGGRKERAGFLKRFAGC